MKAYVVTISLFLLSVACASDPNKVQSIDTKLNVKGKVGDSKIGINENNEAIVQQERQAQDELMIQESVNMRLQDEAVHEEGELKECLKYMADPRLGGNGKMPDVPDVASLKNEDDVKEEFGTTEDGALKVVKKTSYIERLKNARAYDKSLRAMTKVLKKQKEECQMKLEIARNKAGLPGQKSMAEGYYNANGKWVETKRGENSLNDAFEIQADNAAKAGK